MLDLSLNKLGKGPLGNATYHISRIKANSFGRRRFLNTFLVFLCFEPKTPGPVPSLTLGTLCPKLQALEPSSYEEDYKYISVPNSRPPPPHRRVVFDPMATTWTNLVKVHYAMQHTKFQASLPSGLREDFWMRIRVFLWLEPRIPLAKGHLGSWTLHLNKLGKGTLGNASYYISSIWAKWFWRWRFIIFFSVILCFEPRTSWPEAILDPGTFIWTNFVKEQ